MEVLTQAFASGETKYFAKAGSYFEVVQATTAVNVVFYDGTGSVVDMMENVDTGYFGSVNFSQFSITNLGTSQSVRVMLSGRPGGSRKSTVGGGVSVWNTPGASSVLTDQRTVFMSDVGVPPITQVQTMIDLVLNIGVVRSVTLKLTPVSTGTVEAMVFALRPGASMPSGFTVAQEGFVLFRGLATTETVVGNFEMNRKLPASYKIILITRKTVAGSGQAEAQVGLDIFLP